MKKNTKNESAKASKRNQSTWKIDVTSKGNTKIRGKNENVANTNITVNIIRNGEIAEKKQLTLPEKVTNIISCKNPRCITQIEQELDQIFYLTDKEKHIYRCKYCEEKY